MNLVISQFIWLTIKAYEEEKKKKVFDRVFGITLQFEKLSWFHLLIEKLHYIVNSGKRLWESSFPSRTYIHTHTHPHTDYIIDSFRVEN